MSSHKDVTCKYCDHEMVEQTGVPCFRRYHCPHCYACLEQAKEKQYDAWYSPLHHSWQDFVSAIHPQTSPK